MDKSERHLADIASNVRQLAAYAGSEFDSSTMEQQLERIENRLGSIHDALERQIGVLYELRDAIAGEER